jgi:sugar phosphate isomerase/epimerase
VTSPMALDSFDRQLGAFARMFPRGSADQVAQAFVDNGLVQVQLNLAAMGLPTIPGADVLDCLDLAAIGRSFTDRDLEVWGVSATYNVIHPDARLRARVTADAVRFIRRLGSLGAVAATLCTGSRDPENMWRKHPDNGSASAWRDLRATLDELLPAALEAGVLLAIEPEPGNVIAGTAEGLKLLDELGSDGESIGFILDPANLVSERDRSEHASVLSEAFDRFGENAICVHAKDTVPWAETLNGGGVVNYDHVLHLRDELPAVVPLVIQDATEEQVPVLRDRLRAAALQLQ